MKIDAWTNNEKKIINIYDLGVLLRFLRIFGEYVHTLKIISPFPMRRLAQYFSTVRYEEMLGEYLFKYCTSLEKLTLLDFHDLPLTQDLTSVRSFKFGVNSDVMFTYSFSLRLIKCITNLPNIENVNLARCACIPVNTINLPSSLLKLKLCLTDREEEYLNEILYKHIQLQHLSLVIHVTFNFSTLFRIIRDTLPELSHLSLCATRRFFSTLVVSNIHIPNLKSLKFNGDIAVIRDFNFTYIEKAVFEIHVFNGMDDQDILDILLKLINVRELKFYSSDAIDLVGIRRIAKILFRTLLHLETLIIDSNNYYC